MFGMKYEVMVTTEHTTDGFSAICPLSSGEFEWLILC